MDRERSPPVDRDEEALRREREKYRTLFEHSLDAVYLALTDGTILDANEAACRMHGMTVDEIRRAGRAGLVVADEHHAAALRARAASGRVRAEMTARRKDGTTIPVEVESVLLDSGPSGPAAFVIARDISDRKRTEEALCAAIERLREADRRKDEFLGMLSHELRNPLAPIHNSLYILEHAEPTSPQAQRAKEVVARQVLHLTHLVDDLLDVTRIARGKIQLRAVDLDISSLVQRTVEDNRVQFEEHGVDLAVDAPREPVLVKGDGTRLAQVIGNLLHNAAKFTQPGDRVAVRVESDGTWAELHVHDTGEGIDPRLLPSIFEPFTQGKQNLARSDGGLGLGLSLVKGLAELHGGEVEAFSEGPGRGTEVVVRLPLVAGTHRSQVVGRRSRGSATRRRVLIVDDDRGAAETLAHLVRVLGHEAEIAYDGSTALTKARGNPPDIILCDIGLPGMDGYALARELRRGGPHGVRLVAVTGDSGPEGVERAAGAGFDDQVAGPDPEIIERVLH